jgi:hypothetical protein
MQWLFLTCHNYWIVCRLVKHDQHPFLAYSPVISIENSTLPFRAFIGAVLSVIKGVSVEPSESSPDLPLDTILEDKDDGPLPEDDIDDGSGTYPGREAVSANPPMTHSRTRANHENAKCGLMACSSVPLSVPWLTRPIFSAYFVFLQFS